MVKFLFYQYNHFYYVTGKYSCSNCNSIFVCITYWNLRTYACEHMSISPFTGSKVETISVVL